MPWHCRPERVRTQLTGTTRWALASSATLSKKIFAHRTLGLRRSCRRPGFGSPRSPSHRTTALLLRRLERFNGKVAKSCRTAGDVQAELGLRRMFLRPKKTDQFAIKFGKIGPIFFEHNVMQPFGATGPGDQGGHRPKGTTV